MAKAPIPGTVKSRLVEDGYTAAGATRAAEAMLRCITDRLRRRGPVVLAVTPDGAHDRLREALADGPAGDLPIIDQGPGDLGERMLRAWTTVGADRPVALFGMDSPDLPEGHLDEIAEALRSAEAALGPTDDGGIWTLAGRSPIPELLTSIDWGSARVYDQMRQRAADANRILASLSGWYDIDRAEDVSAMLQRLDGCVDERDDALRRLHRELDPPPGAREG